MQEDSVLCRVLEKQKVDSEQDTVRSSSLTFASFSQATQELSVTDACSDQMGSGAGFAPWQEEMVCGSSPLTNAAIWQEYNSAKKIVMVKVSNPGL